MAHPNEAKLRELYAAFARGDMDTVLQVCADEIVFHVPGRSKVAGTYTKDEFVPGLIGKVVELSGATFREQFDAVLANDQHGVVLTTHRFQRHGKTHEYQAIHVWTIRGGTFTEWREYPRDLYAFDAAWS